MAKSGVTGMYAIPTQTSVKFPEEYLERTISQIKDGEHVVVDASALAVDYDLNCWLKPDICIGSDSVALSSSVPCVAVTRDARGFVVSLHPSRGRRWKPGPKPEPINGVEWIPVVELKY
jgi:hypothetical protein